MPHEEGEFTGLYDTPIFYQSWLPDGEPKGVLIIVHGFGEHSGRYRHVVDTLQTDLAIYALDHRGHGRSGGKMNYVKRFSDFLADVKTLEGIVLEKHPDKPLFILGHSMGSIITSHFMAENENQDRYSSVILSGTGADFGPEINSMTLMLARVLSFLAPKAYIPSNLDPNFISRDEEEVELYKNDPLVNYAKISGRLGGEMLKRTGLMKEAADKIKVPALVQIGSEDMTFHPDSRQVLIDSIANDKKELKVYEGYRHEVYNEVDRDVVLGDLKNWINQFL